MKKVWYWIVTLGLTILIQFMLLRWVYPAVYDSMLAKNVLVTYAPVVSVVVAFLVMIVYNLIFLAGKTEDSLEVHLTSVVVVQIAAWIISLILLVVLDIALMISDNHLFLGLFEIAIVIFFIYAIWDHCHVGSSGRSEDDTSFKD